MCLTDEGEEKLVTLPALEGFSAIAVGPGMGTVPASASMLGALFAQAGQPLVIDADALNLVAANAHLKDAIPENSILTPHPKEFARLAGEHDNDFQRIEALRKFCVSYKVVMVLKGAFSAVCNTKGEVWFNSTGNPGMATAGSGDVLTGVIASLLAQGYAPADAARLGVYLHGAAGDAAAAFYSQEALTASDLVGHLGKAFQYLSD
jgi:NAD(P)H-hydrate epimerase